MENEVWIWVLIIAAFYLLAGFIAYVVLEARSAGAQDPVERFSASEMVLIVLLWPWLLVWIAGFWLRRWGKL